MLFASIRDIFLVQASVLLLFRISVGTEFHLKVTIMTFCTKYAQKGYFHSKSGKMNTTIEFGIFKLVYNYEQKI